ncbi:hypothetical protein C7B76_29775 [filamentous cyanobacterium CCP2]|nr:hypothetical protein C7B76_29775 [filamentous cyanobacterium CCP2]
MSAVKIPSSHPTTHIRHTRPHRKLGKHGEIRLNSPVILRLMPLQREKGRSRFCLDKFTQTLTG